MGVMLSVHIVKLSWANMSIRNLLSWMIMKIVISHKRVLVNLSRSSSERMRVAGVPAFFFT